MSKKKSGRRVWRGVTTATASLLALSVCASTVVDGFRTDIDKFLGTKSTKLVTENSDGTDLYTFKSDYTSTTELLHGIQDVGERMSEEGSVLLKNNGALPLTNKYGGRLPHHVRVLWDEAANTGQVPGLEKIVAVIRSREISLTLFYQAMSQCKALYKDHAETIMGNMDSIVFLGGREASTLKDISENWLGKATISMQTDSRTRGQSESHGLNTQRLGRELLTTSEITTMPGNKCLLQLRGLPPFFSPKYDLKQHPNYRYTAEHDSKRSAFHLERLTSRRLRLKPEEEYTVYEVDASDEDADIGKKVLTMNEEWSNDACRGYVIKAMENCGFHAKDIHQVLVELYEVFDFCAVEEAAHYYENWQY